MKLPSDACRVCGAELEPTGRRGRPRATCGDECRRELINARRRKRTAEVAVLLARVYEKGEAPARERPIEEPWRVEHGGLL